MSEKNEDFITTYAIGPDEPKENVGPWFKDKKEWWFYDEEKKKYFTWQKIYNGGVN